MYMENYAFMDIESAKKDNLVTYSFIGKGRTVNYCYTREGDSMKNKVVFFGEADYGKTTLIGYMLSKAENLDMDRVERRVQERLGTNYDEGLLYSSLINENYLQSNTVEETNTFDLSEYPDAVEGSKIVKDTEEETILEITRISGKKVEVTDIVHTKGLINRLNTRARGVRNISLLGVSIVAVDTPGHVLFLRERETGMSLGDVGVFCLAIDKVLSDDFSEVLFRYTDLWHTYHVNRKFIYLLTMCDLCNYREEDYITACNKIRQFCKFVNVEHNEEAFGTSFVYTTQEEDAAAIIPVAVEFKERNGVNILELSEKTPWYHGPTLIEAIRARIDELHIEMSMLIPQNMLVSVDKEIGKTRTNVGKVWRVAVRNGSIEVNDKIKLCGVSIEGIQGIYDVEAEVKSIHAEYHPSEGIREVKLANKDELVSINLRNCYVNGRRIDKGDIKVNKETVIYSASEQTVKMNQFYIRLPQIDTAIELLQVGQDIVLLWFGKRLTAKIIGFPEEIDGIIVRLMEGVSLSIPENFKFQNLNELKETRLSLQRRGESAYQQGHNNFHYLYGEFVFSQSKYVE